MKKEYHPKSYQAKEKDRKERIRAWLFRAVYLSLPVAGVLYKIWKALPA